MPFAADQQRLAAARTRAGITDNRVSGGSSDATAVTTPGACVSATLCGVRVLLPHGCELGTAIRGTELWAKAFGQVRALAYSLLQGIVSGRSLQHMNCCQHRYLQV